MLRAAAAGASGAAAYTAYHEARLSGEAGEGPGGALALLASAVLGAARRLLLALAGVPSAASSSSPSSIATTSSPELVQRLQRQVDDLHQVLIRTLKDRAGGPTTTSTTTTNNRRQQLAALAAATLATVAAVRAAKGLPPLPSFLPDLMYATRGSVKQLRQQLETSASSLREQMRLAARDLAARVGLVHQKQDALLAAQQELERALARVEGGVGLVRGDVAALAQRVEYGNRAVTLLCGVVGEVARAVGLPAPGAGGAGAAGQASLPPQQQQAASNNGRFSRMLEGLVMLEKHQQQHQQHQAAGSSSSDANTNNNQLLLPGEAPRRDAAAHLFRATEPAFMASRAPNPATYCDLLLTGGRPQQQDGRAKRRGGSGPSRGRPATGLGALSGGGADWGDAAAVDASWGGAPPSSLRSWADDASAVAADDVFSYGAGGGKKAAAPSAPPMPPPTMRGGF
jgi:hypothetical protein